MSGWIECPTPGCPGDMRYAAPGRGHIPGCTAPVTASDARPPEVAAEKCLTEIADVLGELYEPAGVLMFWSSRITYLDGKRPCDIWRDRDLPLLERLSQRLNALADGNFA